MKDRAKGDRRRLKLVSVNLERFPDSRCRVQIEMEWSGQAHSAHSDGTFTTQGILRAAALATLDAANAAAGEGFHLELVGVKSVKAFDSEVVIASVRGVSEEDRYRLLGSCTAATDEDPARGAVLAVLDALNRILERYVSED